MFRKVRRKIIWMALGSAIFATLFGYALFKVGLISYQDLSKTQRALMHHNHKNRRVGKIRLS